MGYTPIIVSGDRIECKEKVFEGKELEKLREWVEVDCTVTIAYRLRGWLFFHRRFLEVARWAEVMARYADYYFNFSKVLEVLRKPRMKDRK